MSEIWRGGGGYFREGLFPFFFFSWGGGVGTYYRNFTVFDTSNFDT